MSRDYGGWAPYVPVAERRRKAEREMQKLRKKGVVVSPVKLEGKTIASTFWGKAWGDNLESYHDYENRLPRGRTYVRNGSVVDLQIAPREVTAIVSGSLIYKVRITVDVVPDAQWRSICADCTGGIDSLVELLQGRFSKGVMERICRQGTGLFPKPSEIRFSCSCEDGASMCKHVAAAMYGVGSRLDAQPDLLFRLRAVNENDLVAGIGKALPMTKREPAADKVLDADDMAALFGLDMVDAAEPVEAAVVPPPVGKKAPAVRKKRAADVMVAAPKAAPGAVPATPGTKITATGKKNAPGSSPAVPRVSVREAAQPSTAELKPVEWWKSAAPKQDGKTRVSEITTARPEAGRKARAASYTNRPRH
jgi:uncharacterized Zn finger protein